MKLQCYNQILINILLLNIILYISLDLGLYKVITITFIFLHKFEVYNLEPNIIKYLFKNFLIFKYITTIIGVCIK